MIVRNDAQKDARQTSSVSKIIVNRNDESRVVSSTRISIKNENQEILNSLLVSRNESTSEEESIEICAAEMLTIVDTLMTLS